MEEWLKKRKLRREYLSADDLFVQLSCGDLQALSTSITLIESTRTEDREVANALIKKCLTVKNQSVRVGITGVPGVGKSTFIESLGQHLLQKGKKVAILAIDPSSSTSGGSILGDKTRMEMLSRMENVFIRPSAAGKTLGGVARKTRESILLCEAANYDVILIETVGVGQSETLVHSMVDFFLLLMLSGAGDELQGIKRGIMEMADALVITKADGENVKKANLAKREYQNAMHLFPPKKSEWTPQALTCSSLKNENIDKVWEVIESYVNQTTINGYIAKNRSDQDRYWLKETLEELILNELYSDNQLENLKKELEHKVMNGEETSFSAAEKLFEAYHQKMKNGRV